MVLFQSVDLQQLPLPEADPLVLDRGFAARRVVTIRMSELLHNWLEDEALRTGLSMNQLAKVKLAAAIKDCKVPAHWIRGRRRRGLIHEPERSASDAQDRVSD